MFELSIKVKKKETTKTTSQECRVKKSENDVSGLRVKWKERMTIYKKKAQFGSFENEIKWALGVIEKRKDSKKKQKKILRPGIGE